MLIWPDYVGNMMFNTLGNIAANPQVGLLFLDFDTGSTLQLTGEANIIWDAAKIAKYRGAERLLSFRIDQVLEIDDQLPLRWEFESYSPFNPRYWDHRHTSQLGLKFGMVKACSVWARQ